MFETISPAMAAAQMVNPMAPRPLALHLGVQNLTYASCLLALPGLRNGSIVWKPPLRNRAEKLAAALESADPADFRKAVEHEIQSRLHDFAAGVGKFKDAPRPSRPPEPPAIWTSGTTRLLDYRTGGDGAPVLVVPSLINRCYVLDLTEDRSLMRFLAARGLRPFLVDWDGPGPDETSFAIDDYVDRLEKMRDAVAAACGARPVVLGYCMGGLLALALTHRAPAKVRAQALLATPWDFHAARPVAPISVRAAWPWFEGVIRMFGQLPVDVLQAMFSSLDPGVTAAKYRRFAGLAADGRAAHEFLALEDWLNDGVPLVAAAARECLWDWYVENVTAKGAWRSGGRPVRPADIHVPSLVIVPTEDYIVPPETALPLGRLLPDAETLEVHAGHIGMVTGSRARPLLYEPLLAWIQGLPADDKGPTRGDQGTS